MIKVQLKNNRTQQEILKNAATSLLTYFKTFVAIFRSFREAGKGCA
jgi:hypothetical protein